MENNQQNNNMMQQQSLTHYNMPGLNQNLFQYQPRKDKTHYLFK